jgi:hypothetical protein
MFTVLHVKNALFLFDLNETEVFSTNFCDILECKISRTSIQWELSHSMRPDGQTEMRKLIVTFLNFANTSVRSSSQ